MLTQYVASVDKSSLSNFASECQSRRPNFPVYPGHPPVSLTSPISDTLPPVRASSTTYADPKPDPPQSRRKDNENIRSKMKLHRKSPPPTKHTAQNGGHSSNDGPVPMMDSAPHVPPVLHSAALTALLNHRDRVLGRRVLIGNERKHCIEQREHNIEAGRRYMAVCRALESPGQYSSNDLEEYQQMRAQAWEKLQLSTHQLKLLEEKTQKAETELTALERRLQKKENAVFNELKRLRDGSDASSSSTNNESEPGDDTTAVLSAYSAASSEGNAFVRRYYDRIGDVNIFRERLFNAEAEYQRQLFLRKDRETHTERPKTPDSVFFQNYFDQRENLIREYSMAKHEVQQLKIHCRAQGFEIEEPNFPPEGEKDALDHSNRYKRDMSQFQDDSTSSIGRSKVQDTELTTSARVWQWVMTLYAGKEADVTHHDNPIELDSRSPDLESPFPAYDQTWDSILNASENPVWIEEETEASIPLPHDNSSPRAGIGIGPGLHAFTGDRPRDGRRYSDPINDKGSIMTAATFLHENKP